MGIAYQIAAAILALSISMVPAAATTALFNFDADNVETLTPFVDTNNGVSATFSSLDDPGGFVVRPEQIPLSLLTGNMLQRNLAPPHPAINIPLHVTFNQPISDISFLFSIADPTNMSVMLLTTDAGGSASEAPTVLIPVSAPEAILPEGSLSFSGAPFTSVDLIAVPNAVSPVFAVDDIVLTTAIPEPASLAIFGTALLGFAVMRRSRNTRCKHQQSVH
jgi:hypothetical protein